MITPRKRQLLIALALVITLALAFFAPEPVSDVQTISTASKPSEEQQASTPSNSATASAPPLKAVQERVALDREPGQLFRVPPPPLPPVAAAPEAPRAPPLPFAYMGRLVEGGKVTVFLTANGQPISARVGDTIGGDYRMDAIESTGIEFTYIPLKQKQRLAVDLAR